MTSLAPKLKDVLVQHINAATPDQVARIVGTLCGTPTNEPIASPAEFRNGGPRFVKVGANGRPLERDDEPHVAVYDTANDLTWSRGNIGAGRTDWKTADEACRALSLAGHQDWRLPTIKELLTLVDYERSDPAIDLTMFDCESAYYWTSTPAAASPAAFAWFVNFHGGYSYWYLRDSASFARAVRRGQ